MILKTCMFTENACYKKNTKMTGNKPKGIVVHSTGANNPNLKRYVQPSRSDENYQETLDDLGVNTNGNSWNRDMTRKVCVHAFIGKNSKGVVETYQILPFDVCCWGVASGTKGSYNSNPNARVQFEICEDNLINEDYFNAVMKEAQEFCAYLCKKYNLTVDKISSHKESHLAGYGNNHEDPHHWLKNFGKDMNWFRDEVKKLLGDTKEEGEINESTATNPTTPVVTNSSEELIFKWLKENTKMSTAAICGILANIKSESAFKSTNLQNSYEKKLGHTDESYTTSVDNGSYTNFVRDSAGYGLCQWTFWSRKQGLLDLVKSRGTSIGDYRVQLEYLISELKKYTSLWKLCTTSKDNSDTAYEVGYTFCHDFERPAARETSSPKRGDLAVEYYNKYKNISPDSIVESKPSTEKLDTPTPGVNLPSGELKYEDIKVGSTYRYLGNLQYKSSSAKEGVAAKGTRVRVDKVVSEKYDHPVHVRSVNESGTYVSGVYGWVDVDDLDFINSNISEDISDTPNVDFTPYKVRVTVGSLNCRKGPGVTHSIVTVIKDKGVYTIVDKKGTWGLLKSYKNKRDGWINLLYTKKL